MSNKFNYNDLSHLQHVMQTAIMNAKSNNSGENASYIPQLKDIDPDKLNACIYLTNGEVISNGNDLEYKFSLQSVSKLILLIGMVEEFGAKKVFSWINAEPSGQPFASLSNLERFGPVPSNPLINAGAICLSGRIPGNTDQQLNWVDRWVKLLLNNQVEFCHSIFESEFNSADRNRSIAYLMKSNGILKNSVEETLIPYFSLCSYTLDIQQAAYLPMLLANGGVDPNGNKIITEETSNLVVAIMATCGLYDDSGMHLVKVGLPSKSAVSGLIVAVATGIGGIATYSPRLNSKGTSIRGQILLQEFSEKLNLHFAAPKACQNKNIKSI